MKDFLFPSRYKGEKLAQKAKGHKYLAHQPGDGGHDPAREIGHSNWVFSYADMMTSMVVFLVLVLSFAQISYNKLSKIAEQAKDSLSDASVPAPSGTSASTATGTQPDIHVSVNPPPRPETPMEALRQKMKKTAKIDGVEFIPEGDGGSVIINDAILFESGHALILPTVRQKLEPVFAALLDLPQDYRFIIEGHTDDNPIHSNAYASNWELSAARALAVVLSMREQGFAEKRLSFQAFGEFQPLVPNRDEGNNPIAENQKRNRRAVIRIRQSLDE